MVYSTARYGDAKLKSQEHYDAFNNPSISYIWSVLIEYLLGTRGMVFFSVLQHKGKIPLPTDGAQTFWKTKRKHAWLQESFISALSSNVLKEFQDHKEWKGKTSMYVKGVTRESISERYDLVQIERGKQKIAVWARESWPHRKNVTHENRSDKAQHVLWVGWIYACAVGTSSGEGIILYS